jgi:hypothetical protein
MPTGEQTNRKLFIRVGFAPDPLKPAFKDSSIYGVSNLSNIPFGRLTYAKVNSVGRQWARQYTLALSTELLGLVRSKFSTIPIPQGDLTLNGGNLVTQGREDKAKLVEQIKTMLEAMTYDKIIEINATKAENMQKQLKTVPVPNGTAITMG